MKVGRPISARTRTFVGGPGKYKVTVARVPYAAGGGESWAAGGLQSHDYFYAKSSYESRESFKQEAPRFPLCGRDHPTYVPREE